MFYEIYIMRAYKSFDRTKNGADHRLMENLMDDDDGKGFLYMPRKKLLANIKRYMTRATKKAITQKIDKADKEILRSYLTAIEEASSSAPLLALCKQGAEILVKYMRNS